MVGGTEQLKFPHIFQILSSALISSTRDFTATVAGFKQTLAVLIHAE